MPDLEKPYTATDYVRTADFIASAGLVTALVGGTEAVLSIHLIDTGWAEALAAAPGAAMALGGAAALGYGIFHIFRGDTLDI